MFTNKDETSAVHGALSVWAITYLRRAITDLFRFIRPSGLSMVQITALMHIYYQGSCGMTMMSRLLQVSKAGAGQLVERMAQQGFVECSVSEADRRMHLVHLTVQGKRLVEESIASRERWIGEILAQVPEAERPAMTRSLELLTDIALRLEQAGGGHPSPVMDS